LNSLITPTGLPKIQKTEFGGKEFWFSPTFSLFENGGDIEVVFSGEKTLYFRISG